MHGANRPANLENIRPQCALRDALGLVLQAPILEHRGAGLEVRVEKRLRVRVVVIHDHQS